MAATPTRLMTVEEFSQLPEDKGAVYHELRHGEIVALTRPKLDHSLIQANLRDFFKKIAEPGSYVDTEMAYRPLPEYELWVADVAYLSVERFRATDRQDYVHDAPDLVVEVLSASNTAAEMAEKEQICLANGAREFWVVDPKRRHVRICKSQGETKTYRSGQQIALPLFGDLILAVDAIFDFH